MTRRARRAESEWNLRKLIAAHSCCDPVSDGEFKQRPVNLQALVSVLRQWVEDELPRFPRFEAIREHMKKKADVILSSPQVSRLKRMVISEVYGTSAQNTQRVPQILAAARAADAETVADCK